MPIPLCPYSRCRAELVQLCVPVKSIGECSRLNLIGNESSKSPYVNVVEAA
ncbi:6454_t:CDS:2 [Gigaspora rosea]|nr:6454_t:CDS:2 [Gigaspora rosea]